ncbi:MAG: hypothetical protein ACLTKE_05980 [Coprococcus sp.]
MFALYFMLATLAAGCGSKAKEADKPKEGEPTTLTMWLPPLDEDTKETLKPCRMEENNCTVEVNHSIEVLMKRER